MELIMQKIKIMVDSNIPLLEKALSGLADISIFDGRTLSNKDIIDFGCKLLFVRSTTKVGEALLEGSNVEAVATATSGSEHFDKLYLEQKGIRCYDAIGSNALSVAEYCTFGILHWAMLRQINIEGKSLGIIGYGNVGKRLACFAKALGLNVIINDPPLFDNGFSFPKDYTYMGIDDLMNSCDIISTHTPLTFDGKHKTKDLIDERLIENLKAGSLLLHASRGGVVNESAWVLATKSGKIDAIIDVWEGEPNVSSEAAYAAIISTPHIAGHSYDAKLRGTLIMAEVFERETGLKPNYELILAELNSFGKRYICETDKQDIYELLSKSRDLLMLSDSFKLASNELDFAKRFDLFRKNYPIEREIFEEIY